MIQISQNRDEVGDEIDWAEGVGDNDGGQHLGIPGGTWMSGNQVQRDRVTLEWTRTILQTLSRICSSWVSTDWRSRTSQWLRERLPIALVQGAVKSDGRHQACRRDCCCRPRLYAR